MRRWFRRWQVGVALAVFGSTAFALYQQFSFPEDSTRSIVVEAFSAAFFIYMFWPADNDPIDRWMERRLGAMEFPDDKRFQRRFVRAMWVAIPGAFILWLGIGFAYAFWSSEAGRFRPLIATLVAVLAISVLTAWLLLARWTIRYRKPSALAEREEPTAQPNSDTLTP